MSNSKNKIEKAPAYQWYPKDYLASSSVAQLSLVEEGAYRRALDYCWLNGHLPANKVELSKLVGKRCTAKIAETISKLFTQVGDRLVHERLDAEREKQAKNREKRSKAGHIGNKNRWGAGGPQSHSDDNATETESQCDDNAIAKNRLSSSSSSSTPVTTTDVVVEAAESPADFHKLWMEKLLTEAEAYTREQIQVQTRVEITSELLLTFNAHLHTSGKFHAFYSEYTKHLPSWIPKRVTATATRTFTHQQQGVTVVSKPKFAN